MSSLSKDISHMSTKAPARFASAAAAVGFLIVGMGALGSQDVPMKNMSADYSVVQLLFVRSVFALLIFQFVLWAIRHATPLDTNRLGWHLMRGTVLCLALGCYYIALSAMPLLDAVAIFFTAPLLATVLSAFILKEKISLGRWIAIVVGFVGAMVMVRPGGATVAQTAFFFAAGSAVLYAASIVITRVLGDTESAVTTAYLTMVMYVAITGLGVVGMDHLAETGGRFEGVSLLRRWGTFHVKELALLAFSGGMVCIGFFCLAQAYRLATVSLLASWEYTALLWGGLWGYVFFNEIPSPMTLLGGAIIVASGIYVTRR
jgi:drug/metabolite transporter (DMT)-like permease